MIGKGSTDHLDLITQSDYNDTLYRDTLWNTTSSTYKIRYDVMMKYNNRAVDVDNNNSSASTASAGYLTCSRQSGFANKNCFGPELMFGYTIGDYYLNQQQQKQQQDDHDDQKQQQPIDQQYPNVLLLKIAFGGKDLAIDYRSPLSGIGNYKNIQSNQYGDKYRQLINNTIQSLNNISSYIPNYINNNDIGYQIAGFVWLHSWNDMLNNIKVQEYQSNLINFIRDVRIDLNVPNLPFVIGELGMAGDNVTGFAKDRVNAIRKTQQNVCLLTEFEQTTSFASTSSYAVLDDAIQYNTGTEHYYGRADTYYRIGQQLGYEMIHMLEKNQKQNE